MAAVEFHYLRRNIHITICSNHDCNLECFVIIQNNFLYTYLFCKWRHTECSTAMALNEVQRLRIIVAALKIKCKKLSTTNLRINLGYLFAPKCLKKDVKYKKMRLPIEQMPISIICICLFHTKRKLYLVARCQKRYDLNGKFTRYVQVVIFCVELFVNSNFRII